MQWRCVCINSNNQEKAHLPWGTIFMIRRNSLVSDTGHSCRGGRRTLSGGVPRCMSQWTRSSRPACETKYMLACSTIRTEIQHDVCHGSGLTYHTTPGLAVFVSVLQPLQTMGSARDVVSWTSFQCLLGASGLGHGSRCIDKEMVVLEVGSKEVLLTNKLAAVWTFDALEGLKRNEN